ncbi:hypothetical protein BZA05DRAFT_443034 [Tricharina praecox]|uniref:uncharacterized protein n=1 Tax=Tricharina praecox TaxID=43433 RepID=UPI00221EF925|nr:uncharacterized protein BZA05DRAFT_443034 [Tricharina praecox]KAI5855379.1 hypothetical protein BZA05DRAFT_443034 [Tricharina praecox]
MGQTPSSDAGGQGQGRTAAVTEPTKTCYYTLLSIERSATPEEIKKAYRKKALELHPDRNYQDVERTTALFAEAQAAYEVLSDPQERAWYDSHRDAILRGHQPGDPGEGSKPVDVTTSSDILDWFGHFSINTSFDESDPQGFYQLLRKSFRQLADEEVKAAEWEGEDPVYYPSFGGERDTYESGTIKDFYLAWTNFATRKSFSWCDVYRYTDAPDRRVKRAMEKENMKAREMARREFNDTVASFVKFVRKRDPRYTPNSMTEKERQAALLKKSREQAMRQREENKKNRGEYKAADWTQVRDDKDEGSESEEEEEEEGDGELDGEQVEGETVASDEEAEEEEEEEEERYECIICKKVFRSQGQMDAHEKSKKHVKAVQQLKRQMMKENQEFDLDRDVRGRAYKPEAEYTLMEDEEELSAEENHILDDSLDTKEPTPAPKEQEVIDTETPATPAPEPEQKPAEDSDTDEYVSAEKFQARILGEDEGLDGISSGLASTAISDHEDSKPATKVGKAKAKRAKRAQKAAVEEEQAQTDFNCSSCRESFPSKTKLFNHLKENPGHAKLVPVKGGSSGGGKKKKAKR